MIRANFGSAATSSVTMTRWAFEAAARAVGLLGDRAWESSFAKGRQDPPATRLRVSVVSGDGIGSWDDPVGTHPQVRHLLLQFKELFRIKIRIYMCG
jgi:hypothetical protein